MMHLFEQARREVPLDRKFHLYPKFYNQLNLEGTLGSLFHFYPKLYTALSYLFAQKHFNQQF